MRARRSALLTAFGLCMAVALAARATQWEPPPTLDPLDGNPPLLIAPPSTRPAPLGTASLVFRPVPAVSRRVEREVLDNLARRNRALWGPRLEGDLRLAYLRGQFDLLLRLHGRSPTNLGDVAGAYVVLCWQAYSGSVAPPEAMNAVARQWRVGLRRSAMATWPDAQKQALAEALAWRAMIAAGVTRTARERGAPQLFALREALRRDVLQATGIDFARQPLSLHGFDPR
ncbi:MAG TPA: DUF6683 family protein [Burkholderiaceae bacterium]|nr:DUF6683 family protein [Burkholderiaceae bacterium]